MVGFPGSYMPSYGGYGQQYGGGYPPPMQYPGQMPMGGQTQQTDNTGQMCSMMMAIFQPILGLLTSVLTPQPGGQQPSEGDGEDTVGGGHGNDTVGGANGDDEPITEDPNSNTGAIAILSEYADQIPGKNGRITQKDLKKFAKSDADVPEEVKEAAANIAENDELYNLLVLKSNSTPEKGFKKSVLDDDFEDLELDEMESFEDDTPGAMKILKKHTADIAGLSGDANDISFDDLKQIALGQAKGSKFKDPELRAAALAILSDEDVLGELDAVGATTDAQKEDEVTLKNAFETWLTNNK